MNNDTDAITVTLEDRMLAEQWRFIECMHCSQYDGDFVNDLAEDFARHRTTSLAAQDGLVEALRKIADTPAWGYPERWETTPAEVRQLARAALASIEVKS